MKAKTIKKVLSAKIQDWADSVEDEKIKNLILNHTIVTGGCIASMLLREDVNDYDVYMDSKAAVKAITKYYVKIANQDLDANIQVIDGVTYDGFDYYAEDYSGEEGATAEEDVERKFEYKSWKSYGVDSHQMARCVHKLDQGRVKLFMPDKGMPRVDELKLVKEDGSKKPYYPCFFSSNAISLTDDLQVVIRFHGKANKIHENYDFVHATNYYTHKDRQLYLNTAAVTCLLTKELKYIGSKYPVTSIIRTRKFVNRGYSVNAGVYLKICYQVSKLDLDDLTVLEDQIAGVDVAYFETLLTALRDKKRSEPGFEISYGYLADIIDKIFE